ncbi:MAG TPA: hypothetical protein VFR23_02360 [Jiangellaceae bacterium]|nr:hypothetical protein [Jiangellaceae bacterium]
MSTNQTDPLATLDADARDTFTAIADRLIPAAHGMPSAAEVVGDDRLRFVLRARPDLVEPFVAALRPELSADPQARLDALERDEPAALAALQLVIVGGYYTEKRVRELIGYPGQLAIEVRSWEYPPYLEEGLIDAVLAHGPVWRDPETGMRAVVDGAARTYEQRYRAAERPTEGEDDGREGS